MTTVWIVEVKAGRRWWPMLSFGFFNYKRQAVKQVGVVRRASIVPDVQVRAAKYVREER